MKSGRTPEFVPDRGDVVWIELSPHIGHEQGGRRPVLILSPSGYNGRVGLALMCPITSRVKGYPFELAIPAGFAVSGVILADQVKSLDWRQRKAEFIGRVPETLVVDCFDRIAPLLSTVR